ncbi:TPA: bis(5'-nucleosyl)-tetraphosphatase (symmetrical) YqeK [Candidatus Galligastranaerophilus faecipullorum]|nr:bis(5'-nucleosyl)-tetraphosphatase (symmetrical) YqeK [Candidatus Galligastranaerophilus faecipullorum]
MNMDCIENKLKECLSEERYKHTLGCAHCAIELAKKYNLDEQKAFLAGLLHDCAKCKPNDELLKIIKEELKDVDESELQNYKTLHAPVGAYFARTIYGIEDGEILDAIRCHTIGKVNMSLFEKIIFLADKIESYTRDKKYSEEIWEILNENNGEKGLDLALLRCFKETIKSLVNRELKICKTTIDVYNELLDKVKNI